MDLHKPYSMPSFTFLIFLLLSMFHAGKCKFQLNYYAESCPKAEEIIKAQVTKVYNKNSHTAFSFIANLFHGMVSENKNASKRKLRMTKFKYVDTIKEALEAECPMTVSCADLMALSAREAVVLLGGPFIAMKTGRKDSKESHTVEDIEDFTLIFNATLIVLSQFGSIGINVEAVVALLGAHSIGRVHCTKLVDRLYPKIHPSFDPAHGAYLRTRCPNPKPGPEEVVYQETPMLIDNLYYKNLMKHKGLLIVDHQFSSDSDASPFVAKMASDNRYFHEQFARALSLLSENYQTSDEGVVRKDCHYSS